MVTSRKSLQQFIIVDEFIKNLFCALQSEDGFVSSISRGDALALSNNDAKR